MNADDWPSSLLFQTVYLIAYPGNLFYFTCCIDMQIYFIDLPTELTIKDSVESVCSKEPE